MKRASAASVDGIRSALEAHRSELDRLGVTALAVFGSVARDTARADSDVDILVDFDGPATLASYVELKRILESALGRTVDLVTRKSLRDRIRPAVEKEAVRVA